MEGAKLRRQQFCYALGIGINNTGGSLVVTLNRFFDRQAVEAALLSMEAGHPAL